MAIVALVAITVISMDIEGATAADPTPAAAPIPVAHSALLDINATVTRDGLALHVLHAGNQIPIDGRDVTILVDGKSQPLTVLPEGTFLLANKDLDENGGVRQLDITVAHDGIRETLTGKVTLPKTSSAIELTSQRKQMAWWVLNVVIVVYAVLKFSNRKSSTQKSADEEE